jgi:hypothetical protein
MSDSRSAPPMEAPLPERVTVTRDAGILTITYRWFRALHLYFLLFCIFWDGFLVFWYTNVVRHTDGGPSKIGLWFPFFHVAVGIGLTYYTLAGLANRTRVVVQSGEIVIQHGPLPWFGNLRIRADGIHQLYREESFSRGRGAGASYHLNAITRDHRKLPLIRWVPEADLALYLEQEIEKSLGIEDRRVAGEMPK